MPDGLIPTLIQLIEDGSIPRSRLSTSQKRRLQPLLDANVLVEEQAGSGTRLVVTNQEIVEQFAQKTYPRGLQAALDAEQQAMTGDLAASEAVRHFRDAKKGTSTADVLLLRGRSGSVIQYNEERLRVGDLTARVGAAAVVLDDTTTVDVGGPLVIVENQQAFLEWETLDVDANIACFGSGRLSNRILRWLARPPMAAHRLLHWPDYDPVGLNECARLYKACGDCVELVCPPDLATKVETYGKVKLYRDNRNLLHKLHSHPHPTIQRVVQILERYGKGLEQEVLL